MKNRQTTDDNRQQQISDDRNYREKKKKGSETIKESDRAIKLELDIEESKTKPNDGTWYRYIKQTNKYGPTVQKKGGRGIGGGGALATTSALLLIPY